MHNRFKKRRRADDEVLISKYLFKLQVGENIASGIYIRICYIDN